MTRLIRSGQELSLAHGNYRATLAPEAGGRVASLKWMGGSEPIDLLMPWDGRPFQEHAWPKAGAFPMLPYVIRTRREGFQFGGRTYHPVGGPDGVPIHGPAHRNIWTVVECASDAALLEWKGDGADPGWPWIYTATQRISLTAKGMTVVLELLNTSTMCMPAALGWHPYHPVTSAFTGQDIAFRAQTRKELDSAGQITDAEGLPYFLATRGSTVAYAGWDGIASIHVVGGFILIHTSKTPYAAIHRPNGVADYLCVEPLTSLPGQLGTFAGARLDAGARMSLSWNCGYMSN